VPNQNKVFLSYVYDQMSIFQLHHDENNKLHSNVMMMKSDLC